MSEIDGLIAHYRRYATIGVPKAAEAADALTRLQAENARQAKEIERKDAALKPFAARADFIDADEDDDFCAWHPAVGNPVSIGDLRNARAALTQEPTEPRALASEKGVAP